MYLLKHVFLVVGGESFLTCVDNAAGIDDEVGSISDSSCFECESCFLVIDLVVCSTCNCSALQLRDGIFVVYSAQGAFPSVRVLLCESLEITI